MYMHTYSMYVCTSEHTYYVCKLLSSYMHQCISITSICTYVLIYIHSRYVHITNQTSQRNKQKMVDTYNATHTYVQMYVHMYLYVCVCVTLCVCVCV